MVTLNMKALLFLVQAIAFATAAGTKGAAGNQWNQNPNPQQGWPQTKGPLGGWDDEVSNPRGNFPDEGSQWKLEDSIPGVPGQSYPNFDKIPETSFDCRKQMGPGYYGDMDTQCQVFHICQADGRQNSFLCPIGTIFNQQTFVCDWWFNVNCVDSTFHYGRNGNLYKSPVLGIDGSKVSSYGGQPAQVAPQGAKGNAQQPPVGIPGIDSGSSRGNWPSQPQDQSQGGWGAVQGNQKGDGRPMNQGRMGGGKNWQNRGPMNAKGNQGVGNSGRGQKGSRRGQSPNMGWQQKGGLPNQKGVNPQGSTGVNNQGWNQRGDMSQGSRRGQMLNTQSGVKGGSRPQRRPNAQNGLKGVGGGMGRPGGRRMGNGRGSHATKGFDTNTWSIRSQNFRASSQERKGSGSDIWPDNRNADERPHMETFPQTPDQWQNQNTGFRNQNLNAGHLDIHNRNNDWSSEGGNYPELNGNSGGERGYEQKGNYEGSFGSEHNWNSNTNSENEVSWQVNRQWAKDQTENDYDYS